MAQTKKSAPIDEKIDAQLVNFAGDNGELLDLLRAWVEIRIEKFGKNNTPHGVELNLKKLDKLAADSGMTRNAYVKAIVAKRWGGFYPVKQKQATYPRADRAPANNINAFDYITETFPAFKGFVSLYMEIYEGESELAQIENVWAYLKTYATASEDNARKLASLSGKECSKLIERLIVRGGDAVAGFTLAVREVSVPQRYIGTIIDRMMNDASKR